MNANIKASLIAVGMFCATVIVITYFITSCAAAQ